ncbi:MAG TPA: hypothetical protein VMB73_27055 [Acetobacteraceae bacterium]|nr:hypothetical protein [Acetobacteraceae bacterium]
MTRFLAPALAMFALLGGVSTEAATAAMNDAPGVRESQAPIVKVEEGCNNGYFRDGNGICLPWYGYEPAHRPHEGCPPDRHFVHWANHEGGFCQFNRY